MTARLLILFFALTVAPWAQRTTVSFPKFEDYPVTEVFRGAPAPPKLLRPGDRAFRTKIREGAANGPNFAGSYTIASWGCGSSCVSIAVVDARTGDVYSGPFDILGWGVALKYAGVPEDRYEPLSYELGSRLFMVRGCPEDGNCGSYFYEWEAPRFKLIGRVAATPLRH